MGRPRRRDMPGIVDFKELPDTGEEWESFARDFLVSMGYAVEAGVAPIWRTDLTA